MILSNVIVRGVDAAKPAPGIAGRIYFSDDTYIAWYDDGVNWDQIDTVAKGTPGHVLIYDANGRPTDGSLAPIFDAGGTKTTGDAAVFDANGHLTDAGKPPVLDGGGTKTTGDVPKYDANGHLIDAGYPAIYDGGGAKASGDVAVFNSNGALIDGGAPPIYDGGGAKTAGHMLVFNSNGQAVDGGAPGGGGGSGGGTVRTSTTALSSQASVTVTHGLNTSNVIVQAWDASNLQVQPESCHILDPNNVQLTFGTAFTGKVVVLG
jgi:hypothetical protein